MVCYTPLCLPSLHNEPISFSGILSSHDSGYTINLTRANTRLMIPGGVQLFSVLTSHMRPSFLPVLTYILENMTIRSLISLIICLIPGIGRGAESTQRSADSSQGHTLKSSAEYMCRQVNRLSSK